MTSEVGYSGSFPTIQFPKLYDGFRGPIYYTEQITPQRLEEMKQTLSACEEMLETAKQSATIDKIKGSLKTVLALSILGGTIAGTIMTGGALGVVILIVGLSIYFGVNFHYGEGLSQEEKMYRNLKAFRKADYDELPSDNQVDHVIPQLGSAIVLIGPLMPLLQATARVSSLEEVVKEQRRLIEEISEAPHTQFVEGVCRELGMTREELARQPVENIDTDTLIQQLREALK